MKAVAGLAGFSVPMLVRDDDEVFAGIEKLAGLKRTAANRSLRNCSLLPPV